MSNQYPPFIQFIGTQRSGSNLLRVILNQLQEISAPHPPHILKTFYPILKSYGDLSENENFSRLIQDVSDWVNVNPVPWEGVEIKPNEIFSRCEHRTLIEILVRVYEQKAKADNALYCCCKSMESVHYFNEIETAGLKPFYLHIYRDGRDVALSFMKAIVGPKHIYYLAKKWREEQELSLYIKSRVEEDRFISVRYEDLIHKPSVVLHTICSQLSVRFNENMFDYFHSHESLITATSGRMWQNLSKPIIENNDKKFRKELTPEQVEIFETVAGDMLEKLGYEKEYPNHSHYFSDEELKLFADEDKRLNRLVIEKSDPLDLQKRLPQEKLYSKIIKRNSSLV